MYSVFNKNNKDFLNQPMFFGEPPAVARFDQQKHKKFETLTEKQLGFFWRPEEIPVTKDAQDFKDLMPHEQHIFTSNLKYQTLLDSVQGRSPVAVLLPIVSDTALENWIETWSFSESIHSRSYTHIIRSVYAEPSKILDEILETPEIIQRAEAVTELYNNLYQLNCKKDSGKDVDLYEHYKVLYLTLHSINALEAIRFYVSFACSFAFAERGLMKGNADIISLIARDEALHLSGTQYIINEIQSGREGVLAKQVADDCKQEATQLFLDTVEQEKEWSSYLFKDGQMIGLNKNIVDSYVEHIADQRMRSVNLESPYGISKNPIPWINTWINSSNVQQAPQEKNITSYLTGALNTQVKKAAFKDFTL